MSLITPHGATIRWGTTDINAVSISLSADVGGEIEITSMSSKVRADPQNTNRRLITKDYDACFDGGNVPAVSVEFFAGTSGISLSDVGSSRLFNVSFLRADNTAGGPALQIPQCSAVLTQVQLTGSAGEYVRGSATFKLSGL
jgi:hypothetical protein